MYQTPCVFNPSTITSVSFSEEDAPQFLKQCWGCIEHKLNKNYYALLHDASLLVAFPTMIATLKISIIGLLVTSLTPATIHNHCDSGDSLVVRTRLLSLSLLSLPASSMDSTGLSFHNSPIARSVWIKAALPINGTLKTPIASSRWLCTLSVTICRQTAAKLQCHLAYFPGPFTLEDVSRVIVCVHLEHKWRPIPVGFHYRTLTARRMLTQLSSVLLQFIKVTNP